MAADTPAAEAGEDRPGPGTTTKETPKSTIPDSIASEGDRVLQALQQARGPEASQVQQPTPVDRDLTQTLQQLADRILVSRPDDAKSEIRITLKADTLEGTEISVSRDANGLTIRFETRSEDVARRVDGLSQQLCQHMEARTSEPVHVQTELLQDDHSDTRDQDGRSRNRRDPWAEADDEGDG